MELVTWKTDEWEQKMQNSARCAPPSRYPYDSLKPFLYQFTKAISIKCVFFEIINVIFLDYSSKLYLLKFKF